MLGSTETHADSPSSKACAGAVTQVGGASGSMDVGPPASRNWRGTTFTSPPTIAPLTPIAEIGDGPRESDAAEDEHAAGSGETPPPADVHEFPMQVGDGRGEALHRNPVVL